MKSLSTEGRQSILPDVLRPTMVGDSRGVGRSPLRSTSASWGEEDRERQ